MRPWDGSATLRFASLASEIFWSLLTFFDPPAALITKRNQPIGPRHAIFCVAGTGGYIGIQSVVGFAL